MKPQNIHKRLKNNIYLALIYIAIAMILYMLGVIK